MPESTLPAEEDDLDPLEAWRLFYAGNYAAAFVAADDHDPTLKNLSAMMCGAIARGLGDLDQQPFDMPVTRLYRAYGLWCLDRPAEASECLAGLQSTPLEGTADALNQALSQPELDVLLVHMPGSDKAELYRDVVGFRVFPVALEPEAFGTDMSTVLSALPPDANPVLAISLDAHGPYLPVGFHQTDIPTVMWSSDHDYFVTSRYGDLAGASIIVVNSADEHAEIGAIYDARVAAFPAHESYRQFGGIEEPAAERAVDVLFTGRAFVPYMAGKARFLGSIAMQDDPHMEIALVDDYLPEREYQLALQSARFVATYWRYHGGIQTRAIEALSAGAHVLSPVSATCRRLVDPAGAFIHEYDEYTQSTDLGALLEDYAARDQFANHQDIFWQSPERETRFLKFAFFQAMLAPLEKPPSQNCSAVPVELRGYSEDQGVAAYSAIAKLNLASEPKTAAHFNYAGAAAFYAAILVETRQDLGIMALESFALGRDFAPRNLILAFNHARVLWLFGQRDQATALFDEIGDAGPSWTFDPRTDMPLSHRTRALAEIFCYGEYYPAVTQALVNGDETFAAARTYIAAAVQTYLGLAATFQEDRSAAVQRYQAAVEIAVDAFPAWIGLTQCRARTGAPPEAIVDAFLKSVTLYPPALSELLPCGVAALKALGREDEAADWISRWVRLSSRTQDRHRNPKPVPADCLTVAVEHRGALGAWAGALDTLSSVSDVAAA